MDNIRKRAPLKSNKYTPLYVPPSRKSKPPNLTITKRKLPGSKSINTPSKSITSSHHTKLSRKILKVILKLIEDPYELLKFRLVNTTWKHVIDDILPEKASNMYAWSPYIGTAETMSRLPGTTFKLPKHFDKFLSDMCNHQGNPFPTRCIKIYCSRDLPPLTVALLFQKVPLLFSLFGEHIWSCVYQAYGRESMRCVKSILQQLPNLRNLTLSCVNRLPEDIRVGTLTPGFEWTTERLPLKKSLVSLSVLCHDSLVLDALLNAYADQLVNFACLGNTLSQSSYFNPKYDHRPLANAKKVKIYDAGAVDVGRIPTPWSLTHLSMTINSASNGAILNSCITLANLMDVIDSHNSTLVELYLLIDAVNGLIIENMMNAVRPTVVFPSLKKLGIPFTFTKRDCPQQKMVLRKLLQKFVSLKYLEFFDWGKERRVKSDRPIDAPLSDLESRRLDFVIDQFWKQALCLKKITVWLNSTQGKVIHCAYKSSSRVRQIRSINR